MYVHIEDGINRTTEHPLDRISRKKNSQLFSHRIPEDDKIDKKCSSLSPRPEKAEDNKNRTLHH